MVSDPTWFTPLRNDRDHSRIPHYTVYESSIESDDDEQSETSSQQVDIYGFIKKSTGWFSVVTDEHLVTIHIIITISITILIMFSITICYYCND